MGNELYKLVFAGIAVGRDVEHVKQNLAGMLQVDPAKIDSLIKKKPVVIKKNLDYQTASKYQKVLESAGAICKVEQIEEGIPDVQPAKQPPIGASESNQKSTCIQFRGTGLQALGWGLVAIVLSLLIIPAAWGAVVLFRWLVRNVSFDDGTEASFEGRGKEVWGYFVILILLGLVPQVSQAIGKPVAAFFVAIGLGLLLLPITVAIWLKITRWFFTKVKLSCETSLSFKGDYMPFLGWMFLVTLSVYTIIGWAWASVAMLRWVCRNIEGGQNKVVFEGSGWGLLWRCFVAGLASIFIIPIPWMAVWIVRWFASNMVIQRVS
jgi:uncharacterized membrane protein YjgN (DUF898 family)